MITFCGFYAITVVYFITFLFIILNSKKVSVKVSAQKMMSIKLKHQNIEKHEQGMQISKAVQYCNYKYIFLIQKYITKTTVMVFWRLEQINGISINFNGDNCFEI